jgi:hypothetical protein
VTIGEIKSLVRGPGLFPTRKSIVEVIQYG